MPSRREFLQSGAAASAVAANGIVYGKGVALGPAPAVALAAAVYEDRYLEGRRFGAVLRAQGVPVRSLDDGDITRFWYDELEPRWRREPAALAGFTQFGPLFVVERLAAECGLELVLRVEHCAGAAEVVHRFTGPRETLALAAEFESLEADWPGLTAALACRVGNDDSPRRGAELRTRGSAPRVQPQTGSPPRVHYYTPLAEQQGYGPALDGPLYSWVVARRSRSTR